MLNYVTMLRHLPKPGTISAIMAIPWLKSSHPLTHHVTRIEYKSLFFDKIRVDAENDPLKCYLLLRINAVQQSFLDRAIAMCSFFGSDYHNY